MWFYSFSELIGEYIFKHCSLFPVVIRVFESMLYAVVRFMVHHNFRTLSPFYRPYLHTPPW